MCDVTRVVQRWPMVLISVERSVKPDVVGDCRLVALVVITGLVDGGLVHGCPDEGIDQPGA